MQNQNIAMTGVAVQVKATCQAEAFEFTCGTVTFTFQYAARSIEIPPAQPGEASKVGLGIGDAAAAEQVSATDFRYVAEAQRGVPWQVGEIVGYLTAASGTVAMRPRRAGGN